LLVQIDELKTTVETLKTLNPTLEHKLGQRVKWGGHGLARAWGTL